MLKNILAISRKEFIHIRRERRLIVFIVAGPVLLLFLFGYALRLQLANIPLIIVDEDRSFLSMMVKDQLWKSDKFIVSNADSREYLTSALDSGAARIGIIIPPSFSRRLFNGEEADIEVFVDGTMPSIAVAAELEFKGNIGGDFARGFAFQDPDEPPKEFLENPLNIEVITLYNESLRDENFFLPGIIGILIMQVSLILASIAIVREKEYRTMEQLMVTPIKRLELIIGKVLPYALISVVDFYLITYLSRLVFRLPMVGSRLNLALLGITFIIVLLGLGVFISTISQTQIQAAFTAVFIMIPSIMLSGFVFPLEAIPSVLRPVSYILPLTYFIRIVRGIMLKGVGMDVLFMDYMILSLFAVLFIPLSILRVRKTLN